MPGVLDNNFARHVSTSSSERMPQNAHAPQLVFDGKLHIRDDMLGCRRVYCVVWNASLPARGGSIEWIWRVTTIGLSTSAPWNKFAKPAIGHSYT